MTHFKKIKYSIITGLYITLSVNVNIRAGFGAENFGEFTGQPIPRFVSLKDSKINMRRGPSTKFRIDWVYKRTGLPVMVIDEYYNWRRVRDHEGVTGWIHLGLLSSKRTAIIKVQHVNLHSFPSKNMPIRAIAERNAILAIKSCQKEWCKLSSQGITGWTQKTKFWGVFDTEIF